MTIHFEFDCPRCRFTTAVEVQVYQYRDSGRGLRWWEGWLLEAPRWVLAVYRRGVSGDDLVLPDGLVGSIVARDEFCSDLCRQASDTEWRDAQGLPRGGAA